MSRRDDLTSLWDMLDHAREAVKLLGDTSREGLAGNRVLQLALTRLVEITGGAANRVSEEARQEYAVIPWAEIIGMRNRLVHGYDVIDYDLLWDTVTADLPTLIAPLQQVLQERH